MLIELGVDLNIHELTLWDDTFRKKNIVLNMAIAKRDFAMARYLIEAGARPTRHDIDINEYDAEASEIHDLLAARAPDH